MTTLLRAYDEGGQKMCGRIYEDDARAEEVAGEMLGMETSLGTTVCRVELYARENMEWVLESELEW